MEKINQTERLADSATFLLYEKKASALKRFHVSQFTSVTDYYINVSTGSPNHAAALADDLAERVLTEVGRKPLRTEGLRGADWILVDFGDVIVNIFVKEARTFYDLDRLFPPETQQDTANIRAAVDLKFENKN